jgi:uncharacterized protein (DUF488 family)
MPHFDKEALSRTLAEQRLGYVHMPGLGGFRRPRPGSANGGWRTPGFRGYADYMETDDFERALEELERLASEQLAAIMCAEGLWWRCHRRLISDALSTRGWRVRHIDPAGRLDEHALTEFVVIEDGRLSYPAAQGTLAIDP